MAETSWAYLPDGLRALLASDDESLAYLEQLHRAVYRNRLDDRGGLTMDNIPLEELVLAGSGGGIEVRNEGDHLELFVDPDSLDNLDADTLDGRDSTEFVWTLNTLMGEVTIAVAGPLTIATLAQIITLTVDLNLAVLADLGDVAGTVPNLGDVLTWDGAEWAPDAPTGGGGGGWAFVEDDLTPTGLETGTAWTLAALPVGDVLGFINGLKLAPSEYSRIGMAVTTVHALLAGERLEFFYATSGAGLVEDDLTPTGTETGTSWTTSGTPTPGSQLTFINGLKLKLVGAAPGEFEYTQSGTTLTTGHTLLAGERLETTYAP